MEIVLRQAERFRREEQESSTTLQTRACPTVSEPEARVVPNDGRHNGDQYHPNDIEMPAAGRTGEKSGHQDRRLPRYRDACVLQKYADEKNRVAVNREFTGKRLKGVHELKIYLALSSLLAPLQSQPPFAKLQETETFTRRSACPP